MPDCLVWDVEPVIFAIWGPIQIRWYGLSFLACFVSGFYFLNWQFTRAGHSEDIANDYINWGVIGTLAGAWFGHRFFYEWDRVVENPFYLIDLSGGLAGLASHGAAVGLFLSLIFFARSRNIPIGEMMDRFAYSASCGVVFVRLGNLFNSEIVGRKTDVAWAMCFPRAEPMGALVARHPSQLYESLMGVALLIFIYLIDRGFGGEKRPRFLLAGAWTTMYFGFRFTLEYFKAHQSLDPTSTLTMGQYLSIPFVFLGIGFLIYAFKTRLPASELAPQSDGS